MSFSILFALLAFLVLGIVFFAALYRTRGLKAAIITTGIALIIFWLFYMMVILFISVSMN